MHGPAPSDRVLFLTHNYPRSEGDFAGRFLARLAEKLVEEGETITVLAPHHPGSATEETVSGVRVIRFRYGTDSQETLAYRGDLGRVSVFGPRGLLAHRRFFRAFRRRAHELVASVQPAVIHAHWWVPAGWIAKGLPFDGRLIVTLHGTDLRMLQRKSYLRGPAARVFRRAAVVTVVSQWLADTLVRVVPSVAGKLHVCPMPPDDDVFRPADPGGAARDPNLILCVTRFTEQKRNTVLLDAVARLRDRHPELHLRFIGDGPLKANCQRRAAELTLERHVTFDGSMPQSELVNAYQRCAMTVLPAVDEGFGLTLLEAQLCRSAVVGARSGGLTDIIDHEHTGLLAEPDDPVSLADAIGRLLVDSTMRDGLASAGEASARQRFSSRAIVSRFRGWYRMANG